MPRPKPIIPLIARVLAQLWPVGLSPYMPGTLASAVAIILAVPLFFPLGLAWRLLVLVGLFIVGALLAGQAEQELGVSDPKSVVIDELVGQWLVFLPINTLITVPGLLGPADPTPHWLVLLLGFALFRLFDICKPWLVAKAEHWLPGGWGIMLDDVVAGIFGGSILFLLACAYLLLTGAGAVA